MPTYEYQCQACGNPTEIFQKMSDDPAQKCPHCGKLALQKLVSAGQFQLKGDGWYVTDFRDKKSNSPSQTTSSTSSGDSSDSSKDKTKGKDSTATPPSTKDDSKAT